MSALYPEIFHKLWKQDSLHPPLGWEVAAVELGRAPLHDSMGHWVQTNHGSKWNCFWEMKEAVQYVCVWEGPHSLKTKDKLEVFKKQRAGALVLLCAQIAAFP